ncbi:hypothetical protein [Chryseobacterium sp. SIMBA_028]|uniref:hypothetical protein n=1 Tax=Chryseobacterium sp. SIMBA_028 TaxID=3085771 RepID=UPI00397DA692
MKNVILGVSVLLLASCASQTTQSQGSLNENERNMEFIQQRSNEAAGKNIYQGSGLQIFKSK